MIVKTKSIVSEADARFPALGNSCMLSRALTPAHDISRAWPAALACFPALGTGCVFLLRLGMICSLCCLLCCD